MSTALVVETAPVDPTVVTLAEAKLFGRVTTNDDDTLIAAMVKTATGKAQDKLGGTILLSTAFIWYLDEWPKPPEDGKAPFLRLPVGPVTAIASVKYYDPAGVLQTMSASDYFTDLVGLRARIVLKEGITWPFLQTARPSPIEVRFTAGYANAAAVPEDIKHWIKLSVQTYNENREAFISGTVIAVAPRDYVDGLLDKYAVTEFY